MWQANPIMIMSFPLSLSASLTLFYVAEWGGVESEKI